MKEKKTESRRSFIRKTAGATALFTIPTIIPSNVFGANDKIRIAVLGVNGRGTNHIQGFSNLPDVEVACLCDPDLVVLAKRAQEFETSYG
ncbi:MAG: gfo/Idh/MocA family oxidoreductase, partial [Bacteroidetes bacterium]